MLISKYILDKNYFFSRYLRKYRSFSLLILLNNVLIDDIIFEFFLYKL